MVFVYNDGLDFAILSLGFGAFLSAFSEQQAFYDLKKYEDLFLPFFFSKNGTLSLYKDTPK
jgi:hypothetical protein